MPKLLTKKQQKLQKALIAEVMAEIGKAPPPIQTELPGLDPLTEEAIAQGLEFGQGELGQTRIDTIINLLEGGPKFQPRSQEEIRTQLGDIFLDPALFAFERDVVPQIESMFAGTGAFRGGDISRAIAEEAAGVGISANQILGQLVETELGREFQAGQNALNRSLQTIPLASEEEKTPTRFGLLAGDIRRGADLELANFELMKELRNTPFANPALGLAPLLLQPVKAPAVGGGGGSSTGTILGGLAGLALGGATGGLLGGGIGGLF